MFTIKSILLQSLLVLTFSSASAMAENKTLYINDYLRVGIRPEPNSDTTPLAVVATGEQLELLDQDDGYVRVRTHMGVEGWIKKIYTTEDVPAIVQLKTLSKNSGGANQKIQELTKQIGVMRSANEVLNNKLVQAKDEKSRIQLELMSMQGGRSSYTWLYWLSALLIFTIISFVSGMFWYRSQAMKRLGGLRIYF